MPQAKSRKPEPHKTALAIVRKYFPQVRRLREAKESRTIEVLPQDLHGARAKQPDNCPYAKAVTRTCNSDGALVSLTVGYVVNGDTATRFRITPSTAREITSFDRFGRRGFHTGTYVLKAPNPSHLLATMREEKRKRADKSENKTLEGAGTVVVNRVVHRTTGIRTL